MGSIYKQSIDFVVVLLFKSTVLYCIYFVVFVMIHLRFPLIRNLVTDPRLIPYYIIGNEKGSKCYFLLLIEGDTLTLERMRS